MAAGTRDDKLRRISICAAVALFITAVLTVVFRYYNCLPAAKICFILFLILLLVCVVPLYIRTLNKGL